MHRVIDGINDTTRGHEALRLIDLAEGGNYFRKGEIQEIGQGGTLGIDGVGQYDLIRMMVDERRTDDVHLRLGRATAPAVFDAAADTIGQGMDTPRLVTFNATWHTSKEGACVVGRRMLFGVRSTSGGQVIVTDGDISPEASRKPYTHLPGRLAVGMVYQTAKGEGCRLKVVRAQHIPLTSRTNTV
ncbi:MAG TPA: hypothetical protein VLF71_02035 [Candidatus Saccharimonadales bacterium]|nr:hypothetical protein [Candidatus Saccharimonadales bacterium]